MTPLRILAVGKKRRGDMFTRLVGHLFTAMGYSLIPENVRLTGCEFDLMGSHRYERCELVIECKAWSSRIGAREVEHFSGKLDAHRRFASTPVRAYMVSLEGFAGPQIVRERLLQRMTLMDGQMLLAELIGCRIVVSEGQAIAAAAAAIDNEFSVTDHLELIGHNDRWHWVVHVLRRDSKAAICVLDAQGSPLMRNAAQAVIDTAREMDDPLGQCLIANAYGDEQLEVRRRYLRQLQEELGSITLDGLPPDPLLTPGRFALEALYEPLTFADYSPAGGARKVATGESVGAADPAHFYNLGEVLRRRRRVVLLGLPGCGKTTSIQRIALAYADDSRRLLIDDGLDQENFFPVVIRCRQLPRSYGSIFDVVADQAKRGSAPWAVEELLEIVKSELAAGRLLLLIDGLDEITDHRERRAFVRQLETFLRANIDCRLVMTSRKAGFESVRRTVQDWCHAVEVTDLSDAGIRSFVNRWHAEVMGQSSDTRDHAKRIAEDILDDPPVRSLAGNPLLLSTLLLVRRSLGGTFISQRTYLFEEATKVLIATWNLDAHKALPRKETIAQLAYIAYHLMQSGRSSATIDELSSLIEQARDAIPTLLGVGLAPVEEFLARVEARTGMLVPTGAVIVGGRLTTTYGFAHLAFQEYLAAYAIAKRYLPRVDQVRETMDLLRAKLANEAWQEVISQVAVLADGQIADQVVTELIRRIRAVGGATKKHGDGEPTNDPASILVANLMTCLRDEAEMLPERADAAIRVALDFLDRTNIPLPSLGRYLYGGKYDRRIRDIAFNVLSLQHRSPVAVAGELAYIAEQDCVAACDHHSEYDRWISQRLLGSDEREHIYASGAAMRFAYRGSKKEPFDEPPNLERSKRIVFDRIVAGPETPTLLTYLWAGKWLLRYAPPTDDLQYLNGLQVRLAELSATLAHEELVRMAAWGLSVTPYQGEWPVDRRKRANLHAYALRHSSDLDSECITGLQRVRMRAAFVIRSFLHTPKQRPALLRDLMRRRQQHPNDQMLTDLYGHLDK